MRFFAALAAFLLCVLLGFRKSRELKSRADFLCEILKMTADFSAEIKFRAPTITELLKNQNGRFCETVKSGSADVKTAWREACFGIPKKYPERELLLELGNALFRGGSDSALSALELYSEKLKELEKQAREDFRVKGKAAQKIFALCGAAAAIMII